jgi:hypothetical protein
MIEAAARIPGGPLVAMDRDAARAFQHPCSFVMILAAAPCFSTVDRGTRTIARA